MNAGAPTVVGRADLQTAISIIVKSDISEVDLIFENIFGTEDSIVEEGELTLFEGDDDDDDDVMVEKYMVLWKKEVGKCELFRDIFNSNLPAK